MNLLIRSVSDKGSADNERLVLRVKSDDDVGDYAVLQTGWIIDKNIPTTRVYRAFWFPNASVKAGDLVVLYTKAGQRSSKTMENNYTAHFFYWGHTESIWQTSDRGAVLLHAPAWESKAPNEL